MKLEEVIFNACPGNFINEAIEAVKSLPTNPFNSKQGSVYVEVNSSEGVNFMFPFNERHEDIIKIPDGATNCSLSLDYLNSVIFDYGGHRYNLFRQKPEFLKPNLSRAESKEVPKAG